MAEQQKHLLILGGGSAAFAATHEALRRGAKVTLCNDGLPLGGTCPNVGCVPSKTMIRAAETLHRSRHTGFEGLRLESELVAYGRLVDQKQELIDTLVQANYIDPLPTLQDVHVHQQRARFLDPKTVLVGDQPLTADAYLLATGTSPHLPDLPGLDTVPYLTNDTAFQLRELPTSLIVLGGGYIALECAQMFSRLGAEVTVVQRSSHILSHEEPYIGQELATFLQQEGLDILCDTRLERVNHEDGTIALHGFHQGEPFSLKAEHLLVATGRSPNTGGVGAAEAGIELEQDGFVEVDAYLRTTHPRVYAAGDVIGDPQFVYTASYEGELAARNALGETREAADYTGVPWVIFTDPQVAGVGLDEKEARERGHNIEIATLPANRWPRLKTAFDMRGFLRLIRDRDTDLLVGARVIAPEGGELVSELSLLIRHAIPMKEVANSFHPYLTLVEGIQRAAQNFTYP